MRYVLVQRRLGHFECGIAMGDAHDCIGGVLITHAEDVVGVHRVEGELLGRLFSTAFGLAVHGADSTA